MSKCQASFGAQFGVYVLIKLFLPKIHRVITVWIYFLEKSALTSLITGLKAPYTENPTETTPELIWKFLPSAGLDLEKIRNDMKDPEIAKLIQQDLADAKTLNVRKTPGFFVNGKPLASFGYGQLQELVESEINENY